jgi:hypothetical protein
MRLYDDHLDIGGASYVLADLVAVHPIYYRMLGVPSARLDLHFKQKKVILRGIAAIETAQRTASYLSAFCHLQTPETEIPVVHKARVDQPQWFMDATKEKHQTDEALQVRKVQQASCATDAMEYNQGTVECSREEQKKAPLFKMLRWQLPGQERRQRRMRRIQAERLRREHGFDVEQLALLLQAPTLPQVYVPMHLPTGEYAHYYIHATLCEEPLPGARKPVYRIKDQGMLILTNRRMIYLGRKRQLVLDYSRLLHASRLQGAIALTSESWAQRELFEMRFPLECAMYLDAILLRYRKEPWNGRTHAKVRQLYPSTETTSCAMHVTPNSTTTQWHSAGLSNK